MSSSFVQFSSPALKKLTHFDINVTDAGFTQVLAVPTIPSRRIIVIVQNKSAVNIEVVFGTDGSGILVLPNQLISMDNYNGVVNCKSASGSSLVHIAYGQV